MLRAVLLGVLSLSAVACKSKPESSASTQAGTVAGKVLEVGGTVSVKHGGSTQPLAVGATVEADDTVITGADGHVAIELQHNSARWDLGPNKEQKVRDSIAWNATKATAQESNEATAAAGRPAERSAAGTSATAEEIGAAPAAAAPAAPPAPPAAQPAEDMAPAAEGGAPKPAPSRRQRSAPKAEAAPPAPEPEMDKADEAEEEAPRRTRGAVMKKEAAPVEAASASAPAASAPAPAAAPPPPPAPPPPRITAKAAPGGVALEPPGKALEAKRTQLRACMKGHKDAVTISVVSEGGPVPTVTLESKSAVSAELDACMKKVVNGIAFGDATFTIAMRIEP